jgi:hypothetical protein
VTATKELAGLEGTSTDQWRGGPPVVNNKDIKDIKPNTAIATFDQNCRYPQSGDRNSGIYLTNGTNGTVWILDQFNHPSHPPHPRRLPLHSPNGCSNEASRYSVIYVAP